VSSNRWSVGVDVGGTFTDGLAVAGDGSTRAAKVPSTPGDPTEGFVAALRELGEGGVEPGRVDLLVHGTTIATNALLQRRLARVVLLTTAGFRDVLAIGSGLRRDMYDLWARRVEPLVPRRDRLEVEERLGPRGEVIRALGDAELGRILDAVGRRKPESVAVALLFAYADPSHEERLGAALRGAFPDTPVTLSHEIAPEFREHPRTFTTVVAAGLRPIVGQYLPRARRRVEAGGWRSELLVMQSNGGVASAEAAGREPHRLLLSGPAGGVIGAMAEGARAGIADLISLDMGGTSADACLVRGGAVPTVGAQTVEGSPILTSALDIVTAGAGGGSIAHLEGGLALQVGPESAGAEPGPASYGRGGDRATVTDAHVVAGSLSPQTPLAGRLVLDERPAALAIDRLASSLGATRDGAAEGILAVVTANLARAIRRISIERGRDPRGLALVAFGGAGPLHAARLMRELRLGSVIVPPRPGLLSAEGLVTSDLRLDRAQTVVVRLDVVEPSELLGWYRAAALELRRRLADHGIPPRGQRLLAAADCRYVGQGYELTIPLSSVTPPALGRLASVFHAAHRARYGHAAPADPIEVVTLRLAAIGALPHPPAAVIGDASRRSRPDPQARSHERSLLLPGRAGRVRVPVWRRDGLRAGDRLAGPCIVEQLDATTVLLPGNSALVQPSGALRLRDGAR